MRELLKKMINWAMNSPEKITQESKEIYYRNGMFSKEFRIIDAENGYIIEFAAHSQDRSSLLTGEIIPHKFYICGSDEKLADVITTILVERKLQK